MATFRKRTAPGLTAVHLDTVARRSCLLPADIRLKAQSMLCADPSKWQ